MRGERTIAPGDVIRKLLLAWLAAATVCWLRVPGKVRSLEGLEAVKEMSLPLLLCLTSGGAALLLLLGRLQDTKAPERWGIVGAFLLLSALTLTASFRWAFLCGCLLILGLLLRYGCKGWNGRVCRCKLPADGGKLCLRFTAGVAVLFFLLVSAWGLGRLYTFATPTYDFGIFSQMFHSMRTTGGQVTTLERETAMSHFKVHVSPIYYLMLPFYCLVPNPGTLQVLQGAVLASAVIPLWKLGRLHGLPPVQRLLLCLLLLVYPAYGGGAGYDLHENCFLTPLLLWMLYWADRKRPGLTVYFGLLVLAVKEDAAVYSAVVALWVAVRGCLYKDHREVLTGLGILGISVIWFLGATGYLAAFGDGVMTYRYDNFIFDGSDSLLTVIRCVLLCPMKLLWECVDPEKLGYIGLTVLPLLGLPFFTGRYERLLLLIPWILANLMADYEYQHDIFFQYSFGSTACLVYLTAVNLADIRNGYRRFVLLLFAAAVGCGLFFGVVVPKAMHYPVNSIKYHEYYAGIHRTLDEIPEDTSVSASTWYTSDLSGREILYDLRYASLEQILSTEYVVLGANEPLEEHGIGNLPELLEEEGYEVLTVVENVLTIYQKNADPAERQDPRSIFSVTWERRLWICPGYSWHRRCR